MSNGENMVKELKVEGMMCPHCEMHCKEALEKVDGVIKATPSHIKKNVLIELSKDVSDIELLKAVESVGYKVI